MRSIRVSVLVPAATGIALAIAGVYQLTQWKQLCLHHCRSPLEFFARFEIRSAADSWRFGVHHGDVLCRVLLGTDGHPARAGRDERAPDGAGRARDPARKTVAARRSIGASGRRGVARRRHCPGASGYNSRKAAKKKHDKDAVAHRGRRNRNVQLRMGMSVPVQRVADTRALRGDGCGPHSRGALRSDKAGRGHLCRCVLVARRRA